MHALGLPVCVNIEPCLLIVFRLVGFSLHCSGVTSSVCVDTVDMSASDTWLSISDEQIKVDYSISGLISRIRVHNTGLQLHYCIGKYTDVREEGRKCFI